MSDQSSRREELARKILENSTETWPDELKALHVPMRSMPVDLRQKLNDLTKSAQSAGQPVAPGRAVGSPVVRLPVIRSRVFRIVTAGAGGVAAAAAATFVVYLALFRGATPHATLVFSDGAVTRDAQSLAAGAQIISGETIAVGDQGVAVLNAERAGRQTLLRLRGAAELELEVLNSERIVARLHRGGTYAQVDAAPDVAPDVAAGWPLAVVTPFAQASVAGTAFTVEVSGGSTLLATQEGSVVLRRRWNELEDLPPHLFARSSFLARVRQIFVDASATVPAGSESAVDADDFARRLEQSGAIAIILNDSVFLALRRSNVPTEDEIQRALARLDQAFPTPEDRNESLRLLATAFGQPPLVRTSDFAIDQARRLALVEPGDGERERRYEALRAARPGMDAATFRREALRALGKAPQEVRLQNGETIFGVIFGENGKYRIYTADGIRVVAPDAIEEIRFN